MRKNSVVLVLINNCREWNFLDCVKTDFARNYIKRIHAVPWRNIVVSLRHQIRRLWTWCVYNTHMDGAWNALRY